MDPTPEDVTRLARAREEFIFEREKALGRTITGLERRLLNEVLGKFAELLSNSNGIVTFRGSQVTISNALDKIFNQFNRNENMDAVRGMANDLAKLGALNSRYYGMYTTSEKRTTAIAEQVDGFMQSRIGIGEQGSIAVGGFLDTFVKDPGLKEYLKKYVYNQVTGGAPYKTFVEGLRVAIEGTDGTDGKLRQHYKTFAFDTYSQYDAGIGNQWRIKLNLKAGLYAGNLIETSRKFCIERAKKVFTLEEMQTWINDPDLPRTKEERDAGQVFNYVPQIDKGRWRCRHQINWLSKQIAIQLRPDLVNYFNGPAGKK